eukprot:7108508-Alexandrium_andersonii.AAC.1
MPLAPVALRAILDLALPVLALLGAARAAPPSAARPRERWPRALGCCRCACRGCCPARRARPARCRA